MLIDRRCWLTGDVDWQEQELIDRNKNKVVTLPLHHEMGKSNLHLDKRDKAVSVGAVLGASVIFQSTIGFFPFERWPYTFVWVLSFVINLAAIPERMHGSALYLYRSTTGHSSIKLLEYEERKNVKQCVTDCYDLNCYLMFKRHLAHVFYILDMTGWKYSRASGNPKYIDLLWLKSSLPYIP